MPEFIDTMFIKPTSPDMIVRDPVNFEQLPVDGAEKPRNQHWLRRLRDGDVVEAKMPKPVAKEPKE